MDKIINIAIDGPSGAGKSTIAKSLADQYNIAYLDTGAMYRAIGLYIDRLGIDSEDTKAICAVLNDIMLSVVYNNNIQLIYMNGEDVSAAIREHKMSKIASNVSKIPDVRRTLVEMQRDIASKASVVLDGRDITSYVLPNADYKFYLDAKPEVRAMRRYDELVAKGNNVDFKVILQDIMDRDYNDMNRSFAPLKRTDDSIYIDTSEMSRDEALAAMMSYIAL